MADQVVTDDELTAVLGGAALVAASPVSATAGPLTDMTSLINAINAFSPSTGITAEVSTTSGSIVLSQSAGEDIRIDPAPR
jgi:lipid-binding SYLF domain-containing protein